MSVPRRYRLHSLYLTDSLSLSCAAIVPFWFWPSESSRKCGRAKSLNQSCWLALHFAQIRVKRQKLACFKISTTLNFHTVADLDRLVPVDYIWLKSRKTMQNGPPVCQKQFGEYHRPSDRRYLNPVENADRHFVRSPVGQPIPEQTHQQRTAALDRLEIQWFAETHIVRPSIFFVFTATRGGDLIYRPIVLVSEHATTFVVLLKTLNAGLVLWIKPCKFANHSFLHNLR